MIFLHLSYLGMGQNLLSIFMGWTSILTQLFCGSPGVPGVMTHSHLNPLSILWKIRMKCPSEAAMARWVHRGANPTAGAPCGSRNRLEENPMDQGWRKKNFPGNNFENDHRNSWFTYWKWWFTYIHIILSGFLVRDVPILKKDGVSSSMGLKSMTSHIFMK